MLRLPVLVLQSQSNIRSIFMYLFIYFHFDCYHLGLTSSKTAHCLPVRVGALLVSQPTMARRRVWFGFWILSQVPLVAAQGSGESKGMSAFCCSSFTKNKCPLSCCLEDSLFLLPFRVWCVSVWFSLMFFYFVIIEFLGSGGCFTSNLTRVIISLNIFPFFSFRGSY